MAKVTGIGGVFFKAKGDKDALLAWYQRCLGFELEDFGGAVLKWPDDTAEDQGLTVWCLAEPESNWFAPSESSFMVNYRVDDMDGIVERLTSNGVALLEGPQEHENGRFLWVCDPDGNKIELWEPKLWVDETGR